MDTDPKKGAARMKASLAATPMSAVYLMGLAFADGARKYGAFNWRESAVGTSTYLDAIKRHISAYEAGEECAPDSGIPHLAHVMAGCGILLDAKLHNSLVDERRPSEPLLDLLNSIAAWRGDQASALSAGRDPEPLF